MMVEAGRSPFEEKLKEGNATIHEAYANHFVEVLHGLHVPQIPVETQPVIQDTSVFDNTLTVGFIGTDESAVAITVASENPKSTRPIQTLLIVPQDNGWPIYRDEHNQLWCDAFYSMQDGCMQPVITQTPIPLDMVIDNYSTTLRFEEGDRTMSASSKLEAVTNDKHKTRELLVHNGISVPVGLHITSTEADIEPFVDQFFALVPDASDIVVKGTKGSMGSYVRMYTTDEKEDAVTYAYALQEKGKDLLLEERIYPLPLEIPNKDGEVLPAHEVDYNFRVLVTASPDPKVIDSEIRYARKSGDPVNVSRGASAIRPDGILPETVLEEVYRVSLDATRVVFQATCGDQPLVAIIGTDVIFDAKGKPYTLEVNSGAVGGFGTLTRLDAKPLESVSTTFLPSLESVLSASRDQRTEAMKLEQIPLKRINNVQLAEMYFNALNIKKTAEHLEKVKEQDPQKFPLYYILGCCYFLEGEYEKAVENLTHEHTKNPGSKTVAEMLSLVCTMVGEYEKARDVIEKYLKTAEVVTHEMLFDRAIAELKVTNDLDAALHIMNTYAPELVQTEDWEKSVERLYGIHIVHQLTLANVNRDTITDIQEIERGVVEITFE